jgi:hypothetical protein
MATPANDESMTNKLHLMLNACMRISPTTKKNKALTLFVRQIFQVTFSLPCDPFVVFPRAGIEENSPK